MTALLEVTNLVVTFPGASGVVRPVDGVNFSLGRGECLALVGESGCGKSLTSLALLRLLPAPGLLAADSEIEFDGAAVTTLDSEALRQLRGRRIGIVFQDPMTSLNPVFTCGDQIAEGIRAHAVITKSEAWRRAVALMTEVGIADPERRATEYPHQLSGGMRQRVMIAIALASEPDLLIADEPTTALDVTVQAQILELLDALRKKRGMALLLITHDLGVVAGRADRVAVMYAGKIVEEGLTEQVFAHPSHPYTQGLFNSIPRLTGPLNRLTPIQGQVPAPGQWPTGCRFRSRCPKAHARCEHEPPVVELGQDHTMRCWLGLESENSEQRTAKRERLGLDSSE